jgi:hypothetical protein
MRKAAASIRDAIRRASPFTMPPCPRAELGHVWKVRDFEPSRHKSTYVDLTVKTYRSED